MLLLCSAFRLPAVLVDRLGKHMRSAGANTNPLHRAVQELLNEGDVLLGVLGQLGVFGDLGSVRLPAGQSLVDALDLFQHVQVLGEGLQHLTVVLVANGNLELLQLVQNIQLGDIQAGVAVDPGGVLEHDQIEPSTSSSSAGGDTKLGTNLLQVLSDIVELLGGEGTSANSGGVGLDNTVDVSNGGGDTQTSANTSDSGVGGGDVRIGTKVEIQHQSVGSLDEDSLVGLDGLVHEGDGVDDEGSQIVSELLVSLDLLLDVVVKVTVSLLSSADKSSESRLELLPSTRLLRDQVVDSDTGSRGLGGVSRTNTLAGGANGLLGGRQLLLLETVSELVEVKDQVASRRHEKSVSAVKTLVLNGLELVEERGDVDHDSGTKQVLAVGVDKAGGQHVEVVLDITNHNGVSSVVSTLASSTNVDLVAENIHELSLSFVAPLGA